MLANMNEDDFGMQDEGEVNLDEEANDKMDQIAKESLEFSEVKSKESRKRWIGKAFPWDKEVERANK